MKRKKKHLRNCTTTEHPQQTVFAATKTLPTPEPEQNAAAISLLLLHIFQIFICTEIILQILLDEQLLPWFAGIDARLTLSLGQCGQVQWQLECKSVSDD